MRETCRKCGSSYFFADSKIPEEGLLYKCPRCGNMVSFRKGNAADSDSMFSETGDSGINPVVRGSYAGALSGLGCAVPSVMMTLLGIGFLSLGMEVSGYSAAGAVLMALLKMLSTGVLIGISLAFIGAKTGRDLWSLPGGLIGTLIGSVIGLMSGIFIGTVMGGVFGIAVVVGSVFAWTIKAALLTTCVILVRKYVLSQEDEGLLSTPLSSLQMTAVGVFCFLMVFTFVMEIKGHGIARSAVERSKQAMSAEGLAVTDREDSVNGQGDLVITGKILNSSASDKTGWIVVAQILDEGGEVLRKATVMNGMQMHSVKDLEILRRRGERPRRPDPGETSAAMVIKAGDSVPFELIFLDPPAEYKELTLTLKNFDQDSMREIITERIGDLQEMQRQGEVVR